MEEMNGCSVPGGCSPRPFYNNVFAKRKQCDSPSAHCCKWLFPGIAVASYAPRAMAFRVGKKLAFAARG